MRRRRSAGIALGGLLVVALGFAARDVVRRRRTDPGPDHLAERWLAAVVGNDPQTALDLARELVPTPSRASVDPEYVALARRQGVSDSFLTAPFNAWDFQSWRHAAFFHTVAREITKSAPGDVEALFSAVVERVEPKERAHPDVPWPFAVWQRGFGVCDRQSWVLCELAYQSGCEVQLVYLRDPVTKQSPHTICEIRRGPDSVWFADPYTRVLLRGQSVDGVAADPAVLARIWPDRADFSTAIQHCRFWTPSHPQDYCPRNQALARRLEGVLKDRCPRFGGDPHERLALYRQLRRVGGDGRVRFSMGLWFYPFRLLRKDMLRGARPAPANAAPAPAAPREPHVADLPHR